MFLPVRYGPPGRGLQLWQLLPRIRLGLARRIAVVNQVATTLEIAIADVGILVQRRFVDHLVGRQQVGTVVHRPQGEQDIAAVACAEMGKRISGHVEHEAHGITCGARPEHGDHHIGAAADTPAAEGLAEILVMLFQPDVRGDIEGAEYADRGIDHYPAQIADRLRALALQQIVHADEEIFDIAEEIGDAGSDRGRQHRLVTGRDRLDDGRR